MIDFKKRAELILEKLPKFDQGGQVKVLQAAFVAIYTDGQMDGLRELAIRAGIKLPGQT